MAQTVWNSAAFVGVFGDPFLRNTAYEFGGNPQALVSTLDAFCALLQTDATVEDAVPFPLSAQQQQFVTQQLLPQLQRCRDWTDKAQKISEPPKFEAFLKEWLEMMNQLPVEQLLLVPGGFISNISSHTILYVVEKHAEDVFSFTVCNKGAGASLYHPSRVGIKAEKVTVQPFLRIDAIPAKRMLDAAFWALLFSLWMKQPPSEYHRVESIYDVLLPWLAGDKLLPLAVQESERIDSNGILVSSRTPQRSNLGFCKSVIEAIRYLCVQRGQMSEEEVKYSILFKLRYRLFTRMVADLEKVLDPSKMVPDTAIPNALQILSTISLIDSMQGSRSIASIDPEAVVAIYFTASANPVCRKLNKQLCTLCTELRRQGKKFVPIVVSLDNDQDGYSALVSAAASTWLLVPFAELEARKQLVEAFKVRQAPYLIVRDTAGNVLTPKGIELIERDPTGEYFPWDNSASFHRPVSELSYSERTLIEIATKQMGLNAVKRRKSNQLNAVSLLHIQSQMKKCDEMVRDIEAQKLIDVEKKTAAFAEQLQYTDHPKTDLLTQEPKDDAYAGIMTESEVPSLGNFLEVPERVTSLTLAVAAFVRCRSLCESLLTRAFDGSSSSRVVLHHQVIQVISTLFVEVLPVPKPPPEKHLCMWREQVTRELQLRCLKHVYSMLMILGNAWQSVEQPSRHFDSERSLAALCALSIFDALIRTPASDSPLEMSLMMEEDGGHVLAHTFCKSNFSIKKTSSTMEFARPSFCIARGRVMAYFDGYDSQVKRTLYDYHMPEDKIELKKYSSTLIFFRKLMEKYGYQLMDPKDPNPPTEMEALMEWFLSDTSPMAREHEEVGMTRDIVAMTKFLCTMETREVELMRRRVGYNQWQMWQLTFDDVITRRSTHFFGSRGLNRMLNGTLKWEVTNFRGMDQDIADVEVHGFLERKLYFGEGPVVISPINIPALLTTTTTVGSSGSSGSIVTEDDIMHSTNLPTFNGTLSVEESEYLMSYLTVPYARIPLILGFFSSRDRVTYLFNPLLQNLLRAVLFESGDWILDQEREEISNIPLRKSTLLLHEEAVERVFDARVRHQKCEDHLGTMNGLLLNELMHSPCAVLQPLMKMLEAIKELGEASVHSADAKFILFMTRLGIDVLRYVTFAEDLESSKQQRLLRGHRASLMEFMFGFVMDTLQKWRREAEESHDLQTACVIHSYVALLHIALRPSEYSPQRVADLVGSIAYVRNWHCFGMKVSLDEGEETGDTDDKGSLSAQDRLLRWLQAQGLNTENISKSSLEKYLKGRPLYLKVGMQTIQAPSIIALRDKDGNEPKLPPGEVLEVEMSEILQIHRRSIVRWLGSLDSTSLDQTLGKIVGIALRSSEHNESWQFKEEAGIQGTGRYFCSTTALKLDIQTGEILWRNDELKPIPDSMTQFMEFKSIFGNKSLHCGLVAKQEHRLWIKVIGSQFELIEWDDPPDPLNQGVGCPTVYVPPKGPEKLKDDSKTMYWECPACTYANMNGDADHPMCEVCGTPRYLQSPSDPSAKKAEAKEKVAGYCYLGRVFSRVFDPYSEEDHPYEEENWFVELVRKVILSVFPPEPKEKKLQYDLFLPQDPVAADAASVTMLGFDPGDKEKKDKDYMETFKEIVVYRVHGIVEIFNLVSYGRRLYRALVFTSDVRTSLHGFPMKSANESTTAALKRAAGDPRQRQPRGGSLIVVRRNKTLGGQEFYIPPTMLHGVIPGCLLENFRMWMGEDGKMRGEPLDVKSQWFRYQIEVQFDPSTLRATVARKTLRASFSRIVTSKTTMLYPPPAPTMTVAPEKGENPRATEIVIRDEDVVQLMDLGFSYAACSMALRECAGNIDTAAQWILSEANQHKIAEAESAAESGDVLMDVDSKHENDVALLMSTMASPSRAGAEYALRIFENDFDLAKAWLSDSGNEAEISRLEESEEKDTPLDMESHHIEASGDAAPKDDDIEMADAEVHDEEETLYLLSTKDLRESKDQGIIALCELLYRLENASHTLIWTRRCGENADTRMCSIVSVELPRLKLKLKPVLVDKDKKLVRLFLQDQSEWFISDLSFGVNADGGEALPHLGRLRDLAQDSVILESRTQDFRLLCPNPDVFRPQVQGEPFSTLLTSDRGSVGWQQAMETRFYVYPIHSSHTFVLPPSLSSTLYLILISLLSRNYTYAMELISTCNVDVKFSPEEKWVFDQLSKTLDDRHPNACACRIKLSLAVEYSSNKCPWKIFSELHDYCTTRHHVHATCQLTPEEEKEALKLCENTTSLLKVRKQVFEQADEDGDERRVILERSRVGGQPWMKLRLYGKEYMATHGKKLSTVRYHRPKATPFEGQSNLLLLDEAEITKVVWNCGVVGDEISGSNRSLGFMLLYECLNGQVVACLGGKECTRSFGDLFTRFLHLKLSRWGRETVDEGEEEYAPSYAVAQLAMMSLVPASDWPVTPRDQESVRLLEFGANLYSKMTHGTLLKSFFEFGEMQFLEKLHSSEYQETFVAALKQQFCQLQSTESAFMVNVPALTRTRPWEPSDAACFQRQYLATLATEMNPEFPLENINVEDFVCYCDRDAKIGSTLPFDLGKHPAAQSVTARDLLKRLNDDIANHANHVNVSSEAYVVNLGVVEVLDQAALKEGMLLQASDSLHQLIKRCDVQKTKDRTILSKMILELEAVADRVVTGPANIRENEFWIERRIGLYPRIPFEFLTAILASSNLDNDLKSRNPFIAVSDSFVQKVLEVLLRCNRIVHINRVIQSTNHLLKHLDKYQALTIHSHLEQDVEATGLAKQILQSSRDLAQMLLSKRHFLSRSSESSGWKFDPHLLVFEYVFDILLRDRQVQMIDSFMKSLNEGESRVQQMIMGAGKTTVVGPLLTYMLADGKRLLTHVMPTALLEQSRQVLRSRFSNVVLRKRIFTFEFDRSVADDATNAIKLFEKLNRVRLNGDVVCASPESIKSLMLKFVELLHSLEESSDVIQLPFSASSQTIRRIRKTLEDRSDMADELSNVIRLWQKGVLIMDEVDVLLHPLRSELNFPIGNKFPIDLAANRWELPICLIDSVLSDPQEQPLKSRVTEYDSLVVSLHHVLAEGYQSHALQRFPHLVLLDMEFYEVRMMPILADIALKWLQKHFVMGKMEVEAEQLKKYLMCPRCELHADHALRQHVEHGLMDSSMKLINLARDWIRTILPHVLSKINRVSYGLLQGEYQARTDNSNNSHSRLLLAVPFIGKDVPSRSSEFAHPDVLIGLTILAYRYEGLRRSDLTCVVSQLKQDFSRQLGPRDERPACAMFRDWVAMGLEAKASSTKRAKVSHSSHNNGKGSSGAGVLPLPLFQLRDPAQLSRLHFLVAEVSDVVYYYVRQHVFPSCMNFQRLKVSACGHELGSNSLFEKRIGFSGTPSNLLPMDLGECFYEPRSDGSIFQVLTNPRIVSIERKLNWTAKSLLWDIARADPPFHALIDTGALITGFENAEVAAYLLRHLPMTMEGVVYLDSLDRKMILLRDHEAPLPLVQCGLDPAHRFTFYDQVHTTGMDIKQCVNARAVLTLGKDMTFRDYAQGAYRMRGIESGQGIHLFLIPEVENRIRHEMALSKCEKLMNARELSDFLFLVTSWLLINSMRMESMQLIQLSLQELHNTWRKQALNVLLDEVDQAKVQRATRTLTSRLKRFIGPEQVKQWLRECVDQFRVEVSYAIQATVPTNRDLSDVIDGLIEKNQNFMKSSDAVQRIDHVKNRLVQTNSCQMNEDESDHRENMRLTAEVVHENEAEAEEEAEEEAEQEEQKMSSFTRDDEHPIPWSATLLGQIPATTSYQDDDAVFYPFSDFQAHKECPRIDFPSELLVSGNYFRRRWVGLGERRLKNIGLVMEWRPLVEQVKMKKLVAHFFSKLVVSGIQPNEAAAQALQSASRFDLGISDQNSEEVNMLREVVESSPVFLVALSLAEGETIRRMIHTNHSVFRISMVQLRTCDGDLVESSMDSVDKLLTASPFNVCPSSSRKIRVGVQCLRYFNSEMYYLPDEMELLLDGLSAVPIALRHEFFECCLRLRRRERHLWGDTPLAKVFTEKDEWHLLNARARMQQFQQSLKRKKVHLAVALRRFDENLDGLLSVDELLRCFESFQLGFSSGELNEIAGLVVNLSEETQVSIEKVCLAFGMTKEQIAGQFRKEDEALAKQATQRAPWNCPVCTYVNDRDVMNCTMCQEPHPLLTEQKEKEQHHKTWQCSNCTFINDASEQACAICELGLNGMRQVPRGKWVCAGEQGGCTFFNSMANFYCEVCNRARPDLAAKRF